MPRPTTPTWRSAISVLALTAGLGLVAPAGLTAAPAGAAEARAARPVTVGHLMTNGRTDPLGIPGEAPSLSWWSESSARGVTQTAYEVRVATSEAGLAGSPLWASGKVVSDEQADVQYAGPTLESATRYLWQVRIWDQADQASAWSEPASFETGLLDAAEWGDAAWLGGARGTEVNQWTDYTADIDFDIADLAIGVFVRAASTSNAYMWQISTADGTGVPKFRPHVRTNGGYRLIESKPITSISSAALLDGTHRMSITVDGSTLTTYLDGTQIDQRTDTSFSKGFVGFRQDFADGQGDESADIKAVKVTAKSGAVLLDTDFTQGNPFDGGRLTPQGLRVADRQDVLYRSVDSNLPLLRTDFETPAGKTVEQARVYASGYGVYELQLNGEQVGDQRLAPGWTDYRRRIQHQTYDVTDQVRAGANALGAELGEGWWTGKVASFGGDQYGTDVGVVAQLRIDYTDGTSQVVDTDPTWTSHPGPFVAADLLDGETYDARSEQPGWDQPGYDDAAWSPARVAESATARLVPQPDDPVRVTDEIPAVAHTTPTPGAEVYDLGQNMVGVVRMTLQGTAGSTVRIRYGEELNPDGTLYTANMRSAKVTDYYTFDETGSATWTPTFTQHGFRYLEITGTTSVPALSDVTGVVWGSDLRATGDLETSDPMLDQLVSNISWGQRGNFLSVPTDTPARDERLGWTGDINVFAPTASYLRDTRSFLGKWMVDLEDAGYGDGNVPGIAPTVPRAGDFGSGLGWSDAAITVPYATWHAWDDGRIVRQNYDEMVDFLRFVQRSAGDDLIDSTRGHWEDWLHLDDPTGVAVLGTMYYAEDARMMSEMAAAIGEDEDAAEFAALSTAVREAFTATLVSPDGTVEGNSQAGYAMALGMGMITDPALRERVGEKFVAKLAKTDNHLTTGFLGTPWLLPALSSIGRDDIAYEMLLLRDYPSWGYEIENGATTMWERWNSIMPDGSFGPVEMNSFNHYAYGAVGDWMYENIGGITAVEAGYRTSRIAPVVDGPLTHGKGSFDSAYGPIRTDWTRDGDDVSLAVDVPVGTTAQVVLPATTTWAVTEGGALLDDVDGVIDATVADGEVTITVGSGSYDFELTAADEALGAVLDAVVALQQRVTDLEGAGDLAAADADRVETGLSAVRDDVSSALRAGLDGGDTSAALAEALTATRDLRAWLASSAVDAPVRGDLDTRLGRVEQLLTTAVTGALGVSVALPPVTGAVLPGATAAGTVEITNTGDAALTGITGTLQVDGWEPVAVTGVDVPAGGSVQLPVAVPVPATQAPGAHAATLTLAMTLGGEPFEVVVSTPAWLTTTSGLTLGAPTVAMGEGTRARRATVSVPVTNTGTAEVRTHVVATGLPAGWGSVASPEVVVPAGGTAVAAVPVVLPASRVGGSTPLTLQARRAAVVLASLDASPAFPVTTPPTGSLDHVDLGEAASEAAHAVVGSPSSGTNTEAGLTRRYAQRTTPGAWYEATMTVPAGQPFVLRGIETFDGPWTKKYDVSIDGVEASTWLVPRTEGGVGTKTWDLLVDSPAALAQTGDGKAVVRFTYPLDASSFYDPSIADLWVLPAGADGAAPEVSAVVTDGVVGDGGWWRSPVQVTVAAAAADAAPVVETGTDAGWTPYAGPVTLAAQGRTTLSYRATDAAGRRTTRTLEVPVDTVAPSSEAAVARGADGSALVTVTSSDATSGVARTLVRLDGGPWTTATGPVTVSGVGEHVLEHMAVDQAGNTEALRRTTVTVDAVTPPTVTPVPTVPVTPATPPGATARAATRTTAKVSTAVVRAGRTVKVRVGVRGATGRVKVKLDGRKVASVTLRNGKARATIRVPRGTHAVVAKYLGNAVSAPSRSTRVVVRGR